MAWGAVGWEQKTEQETNSEKVCDISDFLESNNNRIFIDLIT